MKEAQLALRSLLRSPGFTLVADACLGIASSQLLFFILNLSFGFTSTGNHVRAEDGRRRRGTRSGSRSERTLDAVEHSRTLMEWWPFLIFHRGGWIKVINNNRRPGCAPEASRFRGAGAPRPFLEPLASVPARVDLGARIFRLSRAERCLRGARHLSRARQELDGIGRRPPACRGEADE